MEDFTYYEAREFIYQDFIKICRAKPASESFFICLAIETMKSLIRVKNSSCSSTGWDNLKKVFSELNAIVHENLDEYSIELSLQFFNFLEANDPEAGFSSIKHYAENNEHSLLNHLSNCIRAIFYGQFSKNILIEVTQEDLDRLSQKLQVYIAVYSNNEVIKSQTTEYLPAVYLYQGEENDDVYYGNLIHKNFFDVTNNIQIVGNEVPFVNFYMKTGEIVYGNTDMNDDGNMNSDRIEFIRYILQVLTSKNLSDECIENIVEAAEEDNYNDEYIEKLNEMKKNARIDADYLNNVSCGIRCKECNNVLKETFPLKIHCDSGSLCIKCIIDNYKKTKSLACMLCHRAYRENEINFIKSFI